MLRIVIAALLLVFTGLLPPIVAFASGSSDVAVFPVSVGLLRVGLLVLLRL